MAVGSKYIDMNLLLEDYIYKPMLLGNLPAPTIFRFSFQWFRVTQACLRMNTKFFDKTTCLRKGFWLTLGKTHQILLHSIGKLNLIYHNLTVLSGWTSPLLVTRQSIRLDLFAPPPRQAWQNTPPLSSKWSLLFPSPTSWHIGQDASSAVRCLL